MTRRFVPLLLALVAAVVLAAPLKIDPSKSTVSATFRQMGVPVDANFNRFTAQIDYDAAKPEASKASVEIDVTSFDLGDPDYNAEVRKKEWFNAAQFPKASFTSTRIRSTGPDKLEVNGKLTLKGRTADVSFPMTVKQQAGGRLFEGSLPIRRLAFGIGEGEWKDTSVVADEVIIKFRVLAR